MFDCVIPTREGRHGRLFIDLQKTESGELTYATLNIRNEQFREDLTPVDVACDCPLCTNYTRAYLRHLLVAGEPLVLTLASLHNLRFYAHLLETLRKDA
jgi:queuine tRNA-ribosyltransferase